MISRENTFMAVSKGMAVGETAEVPFEFYDLKTGVKYALVVEMYENTDWKDVIFVNGGYSPSFFCLWRVRQ